MALLQKRPIVLRSLLIVATPYDLCIRAWCVISVVAITISRLLQIIRLFCRILSLLYGSFATCVYVRGASFQSCPVPDLQFVQLVTLHQHCIILQRTALRCNALQRTSQHTVAHGSTRQHTAAHGSTWQHTAAHGSTRHHTVAHCSTGQHTAAHCSTLQHIAPHYNTPQQTVIQSTRTVIRATSQQTSTYPIKETWKRQHEKAP